MEQLESDHHSVALLELTKKEGAMKKIINGKKYDTETAKWLGDYWNGLGGNDFKKLFETLYQKKTGDYFL